MYFRFEKQIKNVRVLDVGAETLASSKCNLILGYDGHEPNLHIATALLPLPASKSDRFQQARSFNFMICPLNPE